MLFRSHIQQAPTEAKEVKPFSRPKTPITVRKELLSETGKLLTDDAIALIKSLNLPKGRHHRREINALLRTYARTDWKCPYSIIRGKGMHGEGDALYAVYRDPIDNGPILIGKGSSAKVKNVQNLDTGEWPVIKVISTWGKYANNEHLILKTLGKADHLLIEKASKKGICKREIVMERANGFELFILMKDRQLPSNAILLKKMALNILKQLKEFHDKGIILRDIKLENILVDPITGEANLIDMGFAIRVTRGIGSDGAKPGTIQYLAPEILHNPSNTYYTIASDIYAAGIVLQSLLSGQVFQHTEEAGFHHVNDGIRRIVKHGTFELPYVVEPEISSLYGRMYHNEPRYRPSLDYACHVLEKYIPKEDVQMQVQKQSQPIPIKQPAKAIGPGPQQGLFGTPPSHKTPAFISEWLLNRKPEPQADDAPKKDYSRK